MEFYHLHVPDVFYYKVNQYFRYGMSFHGAAPLLDKVKSYLESGAVIDQDYETYLEKIMPALDGENCKRIFNVTSELMSEAVE